MGEQARWWFVAGQGRIAGLWGDLKLLVYPNGGVYNCTPEPNQRNLEVFILVPSDLCIDDLRPVKRALLPRRR